MDPRRLAKSNLADRVRRIIIFAYGVLAYVFFFIVLRYFICFLEDIWVVRRIDFGEPVSLGRALLVDCGLLLLFCVQHSVMARPFWKRWFTRIVPPAAERSTYVLLASLLLLILVAGWRPIPASIWTLSGWAHHAMIALSYAGWLLAAWASWVTDHFELFGVRQVYCALRNRPTPSVPFVEAGPYRFMRHPMNLGFLIAAWATPTMTIGHLLFAGTMTIYVMLGIYFEERELRVRLGPPYEDYRRRVSMLGIPFSR
jgi:protein-S-isoprenylcysteine O-methyltransferase Ste14